MQTVQKIRDFLVQVGHGLWVVLLTKGIFWDREKVIIGFDIAIVEQDLLQSYEVAPDADILRVKVVQHSIITYVFDGDGLKDFLEQIKDLIDPIHFISTFHWDRGCVSIVKDFNVVVETPTGILREVIFIITVCVPVSTEILADKLREVGEVPVEIFVVRLTRLQVIYLYRKDNILSWHNLRRIAIFNLERKVVVVVIILKDFLLDVLGVVEDVLL